MALLEVVGARKRFGAVSAVEDVAFAVERGEFFALLGPSGCGKTTLLRLVAGFETPDAGKILIDGADVTALPPYARPVNMMFQSYALFPHIDVAANIAFGLRQERMDRRRRAERVAEMLALVQMADFAHRRAHELSGGQQQRVALARALAKMPKLLLLDEPLAALDRKLRAQTRLELKQIQERVGITFLVVTHDQEEALGLASRVAVMDRGHLIQVGGSAEIYERPNSRFVADFVGEVNLFEGVRRGSLLHLRGIERPIPLPRDAPDGAAILAVRPEKLLLYQEEQGGFAIAATVVSSDYLGGSTLVHLAGEGGLVLKARLPSASAEGVARGGRVWASWPPDDAVALDR
ncbi:MAG TPA: ABC transporter ATP-binding protein [Stellaceae bacterium]|nr:ABC transporter ATP-binding protein [Stellaceae bacterium]